MRYPDVQKNGRKGEITRYIWPFIPFSLILHVLKNLCAGVGEAFFRQTVFQRPARPLRAVASSACHIGLVEDKQVQ